MATGRIGTTPVLQVRWSKAPSDGTTSLSGLDDNSVSLVYSVGYEAVYRNGVLLSRGNDYTATDGTTVTLIDATITGDIIEIFANQTIPLSDTYSQTVSDGKFINNTLTTTTGDIIYASGANTPARLAIGTSADVLTVSGGIPAWAAPASAGGMTLLSTTTLSGANTTISGIDQTYVNLFITITGVNISTNSQLQVTLNGNQNVDHAGFYGVAGGSTALWADDTNYVIGVQMASGQTGNSFAYTIVRYAETLIKSVNCFGGFIGAAATNYGSFIAGKTESTTAITSIKISNNTGTYSAGTVKIYGVK
jgi:hypothetical protein